MDYNPQGFSVHGTFQARILEQVAIFFSRESSPPRDWTCISCIGKWILHYYCHLGSSIWICALYTHTHTLHTIFHYGLLQDIEYSSLCYTLGPCALPTVYIIVCITPFENRTSEKTKWFRFQNTPGSLNYKKVALLLSLVSNWHTWSVWRVTVYSPHISFILSWCAFTLWLVPMPTVFPNPWEAILPLPDAFHSLHKAVWKSRSYWVSKIRQ